MNRDARCVCGETLLAGERVGYDLLDAQALCLRCSALVEREGRIEPTQQVGIPDALTPRIISELEAEARREVCRAEVALWRANQERLEAAYDTGVVALLRASVRTRAHTTALALGRGISKLGSHAEHGHTA